MHFAEVYFISTVHLISRILYIYIQGVYIYLQLILNQLISDLYFVLDDSLTCLIIIVQNMVANQDHTFTK